MDQNILYKKWHDQDDKTTDQLQLSKSISIVIYNFISCQEI